MDDKVEVYLERYSDSVRYTEHTAPPGTPKYTGDPNERYIEATTDERFRIVVRLLRGFKFMGSPKVRVEFYVDQGGCIWDTLSKNKSQFASPSDRSHLETNLDIVEQFIDGQHMDCGLTFGELKPDDNIALDDHSIVEEADRQGRIVVKLRRGHFANRKVEDDGEVRSFDPPEHIDTETTHNKVVHKHHVSHALKHVPLRPSDLEPRTTRGYQRQWIRATGEGSEPIVFTLRYRSREALLALGILDENAPDPSSTKTGNTKLSHRPRAKKNIKQNIRDRPTMLLVTGETLSPSHRARSKGLTPGPLLSSLIHCPMSDEEDDGEISSVTERSKSYDNTTQHFSTSARQTMSPTPTERSKSYDNTTQHFSTSARQTMSPTPGQALGVLNSSLSQRVTPASSMPQVVHSLLSDDDEDGQDNDNDEEEHAAFPLFSADNVHKNFALGIQESHSNNSNDGCIRSRDNSHNDHGGSEHSVEDAGSPEGELVGIGYATPPRYGQNSSRPDVLGPSDQERKRAWSEVLQTEQELDEEEAAAILASEKRERRRRELMDAKRSFLDLD